MRPEANCWNLPEPFGAGESFGDPPLAKELCASCPVDLTECFESFVRLHPREDGIAGGLTVAGLTGGELRRAIRRARRNAA